jgi:CBS domain-containing protein
MPCGSTAGGRKGELKSILITLVSGEPGSLVGIVVHTTREYTVRFAVDRTALGPIITVAECNGRHLRPIGRIDQVLEIEQCAHAEPDHRETAQRKYCGCVRAEDIDEKFPVVSIDSDALDAVRLLAEQRLTGLVVVTDTSEKPYAVLPASQVVRFIVPGYVQDDPGLAGVLTESMADHAAEKLRGKTIRDVLPQQRQNVPVADADDTIIEVAATMARVRSPLVAVVKDGKLHGVITASRLLAAALKN